MNNTSLAVTKANFLDMKLPYLVTGIALGLLVAQDLVYMGLAIFGVFPGAQDTMLGRGNALYFLVLLSAVLFPTRNIRKMRERGVTNGSFLAGCAINYVAMAAVVSLAGVALYYTYENFMRAYYLGGTLNLLSVFGWADNGPLVAFFQQFSFLLLGAAFVHTLSAAQGKWYGWVADIALVAIISVFIPVAALRPALVWLFDLVIFQANAGLQILTCLVAAAALYALSLPILAHKRG